MVALDYEAVGSQAGLQRIKARAVDFAVSQMPLPAADLRSNGLLQVPLVAGAAWLRGFVNIEGQATAGLRLSPGLLASIFLGRVKTWADPAIAQLNPELRLPAAPIAVVHRADGSGTTYTFTAFLAQASADWKSQIGSDLLVNWPVGEGYKGSSGVVRALLKAPPMRSGIWTWCRRSPPSSRSLVCKTPVGALSHRAVLQYRPQWPLQAGTQPRSSIPRW